MERLSNIRIHTLCKSFPTVDTLIVVGVKVVNNHIIIVADDDTTYDLGVVSATNLVANTPVDSPCEKGGNVARSNVIATLLRGIDGKDGITPDMSDYYDKNVVDAKLATKQNVISDLDAIRDRANKGASALQRDDVDKELSISNNPIRNTAVLLALSEMDGKKQDKIDDLATIRENAKKGNTSVQGLIVGNKQLTPDGKGNISLPKIPEEADIANMGFTKNKGTVTEIMVNGESKSPNSDGIVDLGIIEGGGGSVDLSNYYTKEEVNEKYKTKVDKVEGKGLSTNDFTDEYKQKVDEFTIDMELSSTSNNAVANSAVVQALDKLAEEGKEIFREEVIYTPAITGTLTGAFLSSDGNISANQYGWAVRYQYIAQDCEVSYKGSKVGNIGAFISDSIPVIGKKYNLIGFGNTALLEGTIAVQGGSYFCSTYNTEATNNYVDITAKYIKKPDFIERVGKIEAETPTFRQASLASSYFVGNRMIDTMTRTRWSNSTDTKIGNFTPVSATADTITLSAEDAACISRIVILACELQDKSCEFVYFSAASNNTITKIYDFGENVDCRDVVKMQSLHDTTEGAYGIHLSPLGYRALAKDIYRQTQQLRQFSDIRYVGGWTAQFCKGAADWTDTKVVDSYDNLVCEPLQNGVLTGGGNICQMIFSRNIGNTINARTCYEVTQLSPNGATITFPLKAHYGFKGFVRVVCGREFDSVGLVVMSIKSSGKLIKSIDVPQALDSFVIELNDKVYDSIEVEFSMPSAALTKLKILEITLHETYVKPVQYRPIDSSSVVAFLGSSNTQFPSLQVAENLCPDDTANAIVIRPDGSTGDGCGYLPKELARLSGAVVDNWGKSGEKTTYGLEKIASILQHKRYTHIVLSLFGNDLNAGTTPSEVITNIRRMCEYARGCGCIPVVLQGYGSESSNETLKYSLMYDALTQGFDSPFVYTNSALHNG